MSRIWSAFVLNMSLMYSSSKLQNSQKRDRQSVGMYSTESPTKRTQKRRMSMKNRRVSFAPDPELTMIHTFEKDEMTHASPLVEQGDKEDAQMQQRVMGDITAGLPSLGELAEEEEEAYFAQQQMEERGELEDHAQMEEKYQSHDIGYDNVTASVPGLGQLLEEDMQMEELERPGGSPGHELMASPPVAKGSSVVSPGPINEDDYSPLIEGESQPHGAATTPISAAGTPSNSFGLRQPDGTEKGNSQENKWGFVPGNDDTLEVDLKGHGRMIMGDRTYNRMYADNVTMTTARATPTAASLASVDIGNSAGEFDQKFHHDVESAEHPALHQSPNVTDSSMNTASTRRLSVDARRRSISSRRMSIAPGAVPSPSEAQYATAVQEKSSEEDLLAESPGGLTGGTVDVLAGLRQHQQKEERGKIFSPSISQQRRQSLPGVPENMEVNEASFQSPSAAGAHMMSKSPPASSNARRQSAAGGRRLSVFSREIPGQKSTPGASVSKSGMQTPVRSNAIVPVGMNPAHSNPASMAPPGSAIAARYPGSAIATGRLSQGFTPSRLPSITFQDFAKLVEVQFLDNLRRGASINYADLQPNPVPNNLKESYALLCITAPNVAELETAIHTLQTETSRLRNSAADLEVMLGQTNPAIFRHVQTASYEQLEALRNNVASLKKACRAKATALLKDVRCQMEESKFGRLSRAVDALKADLHWAHDLSRHINGVAKASETFAKESRKSMIQRRQQAEQQKELKNRVLSARKAVEERKSRNDDREKKAQGAKMSMQQLQNELKKIHAEKKEVQLQIEQARKRLAKVSFVAQHDGIAAQEVHEKIKVVSLYEKCSGMKIPACTTTNGSLKCTIKIADIFAVDLSSSGHGVSATVRLACADLRSKPSHHNLAMALICANDVCTLSFERELTVCALQSLVCQLQWAAMAAKEMDCIRAEFKNICEITPLPAYHPSGKRSVMGIQLGFLGLRAGVRFSVALAVKDLHCMSLEVLFGEGLIDKKMIRNAVILNSEGLAAKPGLRMVCNNLSALTRAVEAQHSQSLMTSLDQPQPAPVTT